SPSTRKATTTTAAQRSTWETQAACTPPSSANSEPSASHAPVVRVNTKSTAGRPPAGLRGSADQAAPERERHGGGPGARAELVQQALERLGDERLADSEPLGDLLVAVALRHVPKNRELAERRPPIAAPAARAELEHRAHEHMYRLVRVNP